VIRWRFKHNVAAKGGKCSAPNADRKRSAFIQRSAFSIQHFLLSFAARRADARLAARLLPGAAEAFGAAPSCVCVLGRLVAAVVALEMGHGPSAKGSEADLQILDFVCDGHGIWEPAKLLPEPYRKIVIRPPDPFSKGRVSAHDAALMGWDWRICGLYRLRVPPEITDMDSPE
jgi:hypothetical protein